MTKDEMVTEFICPGCVSGSDTKCGVYDPDKEGHWGGCFNHVLGTMSHDYGNFALGLPKGFNRSGWCPMEKRIHNKMHIRVWPKDTVDYLFNNMWDRFNLPVWYMVDEEKGILFVRTYCPRANNAFVDVAETSTAPMAIKGKVRSLNVAEFYDEID